MALSTGEQAGLLTADTPHRLSGSGRQRHAGRHESHDDRAPSLTWRRYRNRRRTRCAGSCWIGPGAGGRSCPRSMSVPQQFRLRRRGTRRRGDDPVDVTAVRRIRQCVGIRDLSREQRQVPGLGPAQRELCWQRARTHSTVLAACISATRPPGNKPRRTNGSDHLVKCRQPMSVALKGIDRSRFSLDSLPFSPMPQRFPTGSATPALL